MPLLMCNIGHGAANVTLGIPRLREIVMTASQKPKTPSMAMLVRPNADPSQVAKFCKRASRLTLSQIVDRVSVKERLAVASDARVTSYEVDIVFFPREEYQSEYDVSPKEIRAAFQRGFIHTLKKEVITELKKLDADLKQQIAELGRGKKTTTPATAGERQVDEDVAEDGVNGEVDDGENEEDSDT
jgi:DNA-directed RNA polymerase I subunit RPA1